MKILNETYAEIHHILGDQIEPLESVQLVEAYRQYLKPEQVRVVLLARAYTHQADQYKLRCGHAICSIDTAQRLNEGVEREH